MSKNSIQELGNQLSELINRISARARQQDASRFIDLFKSMRQQGYTPLQLRAIGFIDVMEKNGRPAAQKQFADFQGVRPASVSALLSGLEESGLIERREDKDDKRTKRLHLTDEGKKLNAQVEKMVQRSTPIDVSSLTESELKTLVELLQKIDDKTPNNGETQKHK